MDEQEIKNIAKLMNISYEYIIDNKSKYSSNYCGVYFLIHNNEIVYIGSSVNIFSRIGIHNNDSSKEFDSIYMMLCSKECRLALESLYIAKFKPKYNKVFNGGHLIKLGFITLKDIRKTTRSFKTANFYKKIKKLNTITFYDKICYDICKIADEYKNKNNEILSDIIIKGIRKIASELPT